IVLTNNGRRAFQVQRSQTVRTGGALGSENAGMCSEKRGRISFTECLRFPEEGSSSQGYSGPKLRPKGVGDGEQVDIPVPPLDRYEQLGGRRRIRNAHRWMCAPKQ